MASETIDSLKQIKIDGIFTHDDELPEYEEGKMENIIVCGRLYSFNTISNEWKPGDVVQGPRGEKGLKGDKGEKGDPGKDLKIDGVFTHDEVQDGFPEYEEGTMESIVVCGDLYVYDKNEEQGSWKCVGRIKGDKGDKGEQGEQGEIGPPVSIIHCSQAHYDELPEKDEHTLYFITSLF